MGLLKYLNRFNIINLKDISQCSHGDTRNSMVNTWTSQCNCKSHAFDALCLKNGYSRKLHDAK